MLTWSDVTFKPSFKVNTESLLLLFRSFNKTQLKYLDFVLTSNMSNNSSVSHHYGLNFRLRCVLMKRAVDQ